MSTSGLSLVHSVPLNYLISLPHSNTSETGPWPVLCFLHGLGEAAPLDIHVALTRHGPLRVGNPPQVLTHFIIVAPQLPEPGGDIWIQYALTVRQLVKAVQEQYYGDPKRTYLTGFSFGGNGVLDLASAQSDFWAALWAVDLTRIVAPLERPIWLCLRQGHPRTNDFIAGLKLLPPETDPQGNRLYTVYGRDHVDAATLAYRDSRIYDWLLGKSI